MNLDEINNFKVLQVKRLETIVNDKEQWLTWIDFQINHLDFNAYNITSILHKIDMSDDKELIYSISDYGLKTKEDWEKLGYMPNNNSTVFHLLIRKNNHMNVCPFYAKKDLEKINKSKLDKLPICDTPFNLKAYQFASALVQLNLWEKWETEGKILSAKVDKSYKILYFSHATNNYALAIAKQLMYEMDLDNEVLECYLSDIFSTWFKVQNLSSQFNYKFQLQDWIKSHSSINDGIKLLGKVTHTGLYYVKQLRKILLTTGEKEKQEQKREFQRTVIWK